MAVEGIVEFRRRRISKLEILEYRERVLPRFPFIHRAILTKPRNRLSSILRRARATHRNRRRGVWTFGLPISRHTRSSFPLPWPLAGPGPPAACNERFRTNETACATGACGPSQCGPWHRVRARVEESAAGPARLPSPASVVRRFLRRGVFGFRLVWPVQ